MKTDVFDDILCLCMGNDLTTFRREFAEIVGTLNRNEVGYFLTGSAAVSEYVNPFATTELDIQLFTHSVAEVADLLIPLDLDLTRDNNQLLIKSKQQTGRNFELLIYVHQPVPFASQHYQPGGFASVLGVPQVPVADIQLLIWYQLRWMLEGGRHDRLQYKVYLAQLLASERFLLDTTREWLTANAEPQIIQRFESAVCDMEHAKLNPGLSWEEVQERKKQLYQQFMRQSKSGSEPVKD